MNPQDKNENNHIVIKDIVIPAGSILIAAIPVVTQSSPYWWVNLAIPTYVVVLVYFLATPPIKQYLRKRTDTKSQLELEAKYRPKLQQTLDSFAPMLEPNRIDTVWYQWNELHREHVSQVISPNEANYQSLKIWLKNLHSHAESREFQALLDEISDWIWQYIRFCDEASRQVETARQQLHLDENKLQEFKQNWQKIAEQHNFAINSWKEMCFEINAQFKTTLCKTTYYDTLKTFF